MKKTALCLALLVGYLSLPAAPAAADDVYVVRIRAYGGVRADGNLHYWEDDLRLHNSGDISGYVRIASVSNGVTIPVSDPLSIPSGKTILFSLGDSGSQQPLPAMMVLHLDVEGDMVIASRLLSGERSSTSAESPISTFGGVPLPVVRQLIPAGQEQVFLNADLLGLDSRLNVSLYNAGQVAAHALVELVGECDDQVSATFNFTVSANSIQQFPSLGPQPLCDPQDMHDRPTYLRITMDQPGFSFATMLADSGDLNVPLGTVIPNIP